MKKVTAVAAMIAIIMSTLVGCDLDITQSGTSQSATASQTSSVATDFSALQNQLKLATGSSNTSSSAQATATAATTNTGRSGIADTVSKIADSVVAINVSGVAYDYFNTQYPVEGAGSGVIITTDGYIVTNCHVVSGGTKITVFLHNGKTYAATVVGQDTTADLALLKIEATGLTAAKLGDSSTLRVGDAVIAIGNPLGELQGTVTTGIVSALQRQIQVENRTMTLMQTDASINAGNSGAGLFDSNGTLIGIVTAKNSSTGVEGIGFFIPVDTAKSVILQLKQYGYVTGRPFVGIATTDIGDALSARMNGVSWLGTYISSVETGGPADTAGLKVADYIVSINGTAIASSTDATSLINGQKVGSTLTFVVRRNNSTTPVTVKVTVGERKGDQ